MFIALIELSITMIEILISANIASHIFTYPKVVKARSRVLTITVKIIFSLAISDVNLAIFKVSDIL